MKKNKVTIVITTLAIIILTIVAIVIIKSYNNSKTDNIQLNTEVWISPLTKYTIDNTNDIFEVTNKYHFLSNTLLKHPVGSKLLITNLLVMV